METVTARLGIEIHVDCPNDDCDGSFLNLLDEDEMGGDLNEEGFLLSQACPDGCWSEEHKEFDAGVVTCPHCKTKFNVKGMEW